MKKICILTSGHFASDVRVFHKEARTLVEEGYEVSLIAQNKKNESPQGLKIITLPRSKGRFFRMFVLTKTIYKLALKEKADVYHFHDPELLLWMTKLKKKTGAKIIYDVHEDVPKQIFSKHWIPKILRKPISILFEFYEGRKIREFDFIITVGKEVRERFEKINPNVEEIKNFPILKNFEETSRNRSVGKKKFFNIIYAGGITDVRGTTQMIEALEYLPSNTKLILLGKFSSEKYEKNLKSLKGFNKVDYKGVVDFKDVPLFYQKSDVGIICFLPEPNHLNAVPNKFFEYMAAGLPIVVSNFPSWERIIQENSCGICIDPLKPKKIAQAIKYLIDHPKEAIEMGKNGKNAVFKKYNWGEESKKLIEVYKKVFKS